MFERDALARPSNTRGAKRRMTTSREREQAAQELMNEEANAIERDKAAAIKALREFSTTADRLPDDFVMGEIHNS
jgi:hypothetical protein